MDGAEEEFLFELRLEPQVKERRPPKVLYNNLYENGFKEKRQLINIKWGKKKKHIRREKVKSCMCGTSVV